MTVLVLLIGCALPFMYAGHRATRGLPAWSRLAGTSIPPVVLVSGALTFFGLSICEEADTLSASQEATCNITSSLAAPVTTGYVILVALTWLAAMLANGTSTARKAALGLSGIVALLPLALVLGLWAYVQL
jgi:hypothetical protein